MHLLSKTQSARYSTIWACIVHPLQQVYKRCICIRHTWPPGLSLQPMYLHITMATHDCNSSMHSCGSTFLIRSYTVKGCEKKNKSQHRRLVHWHQADSSDKPTPKHKWKLENQCPKAHAQFKVSKDAPLF